MDPHEQQHDDDGDNLAALEARAEQEAAEAEARAVTAAAARARLDAARKAHAQQQLAPLRQRQRELDAALIEVDEQVQALIASALAEALKTYREARGLYRERQTVANAALALGGSGTGEPVPTFERFVMVALTTFRARSATWMEVAE